ncbi:hypothetical protein DER71_12320 [Halanaerobium sp. DL-01]|uniref:hypothetical protein n=1 Tax=Halanaerobium sp. DL-01 TaxID=1653064 RepID=UPI000E1A5ED5|nr:hypothetical protein [Halanaerobium sp. DL-01]RCW81655.1 hypothetical protein DER71_12320 [Halanaerobium sp. DL-01]
MQDRQIKLLNDLYNNLCEINEEGLNDDHFYDWLNENYFFEKDLEEIIHEMKSVLEKI